MEPQQTGEENKERVLKPGEQLIVPVIEEQLKIDKKIIETGKVQIKKVVHEETDSYTVPYVEEQVNIERISKNIFVDEVPPAIRYEDDVMIISVLQEVAVIEKKMMLVEEVRVTKIKTQRKETHEVVLKKEEIEITRSSADSLS